MRATFTIRVSSRYAFMPAVLQSRAVVPSPTSGALDSPTASPAGTDAIPFTTSALFVPLLVSGLVLACVVRITVSCYCRPKHSHVGTASPSIERTISPPILNDQEVGLSTTALVDNEKEQPPSEGTGLPRPPTVFYRRSPLHQGKEWIALIPRVSPFRPETIFNYLRAAGVRNRLFVNAVMERSGTH